MRSGLRSPGLRALLPEDLPAQDLPSEALLQADLPAQALLPLRSLRSGLCSRLRPGLCSGLLSFSTAPNAANTPEGCPLRGVSFWGNEIQRLRKAAFLTVPLFDVFLLFARRSGKTENV